MYIGHQCHKGNAFFFGRSSKTVCTPLLKMPFRETKEKKTLEVGEDGGLRVFTTIGFMTCVVTMLYQVSKAELNLDCGQEDGKILVTN
jgi:hypothetical protein